MTTRSDGLLISAALAVSATCVAYFHLLDRAIFSSVSFAPIFRELLTVYDARTAWVSLAICAVAALYHRTAFQLKLVDFLGSHPYSSAAACAAILAAVARLVYHGYPLSMDEYAAVFQAKVFAAGHISVRIPPDLVDWLVVSGFNGAFLNVSPESGMAIGHYWPGFALLLAAFEFLNVPSLCNASVSGIALVLIYWITHEITQDRRSAGWAMLFALASGAFVATSISFYSMQAHLALNLAFAGLLLKPTRARAFGAGLAGSLALTLHNPVPHAVFAAPWLLSILSEREQRRYFLPLLLGYLPGLALGVGWFLFRSDIGPALRTAGVTGRLTEGAFTWPDTSVLNMRAAAAVKMWEWSWPGLFLFAALGRARLSEVRSVRLLSQSALLTFFAYFFVPYDQGHGWGFRYFHSAWGAVPILAGCAMARLSGDQGRRLVAFAGASAILSLLIVVPLQMRQIERIISQHLAQVPEPKTPGNNVYFIHPSGGFYAADMVQMDPLLRNRDLFFVSHGATADARLMAQHWPEALKISSTAAADQWYLGARDHRVPVAGSNGGARFIFTPQAPPIAGGR